MVSVSLVPCSSRIGGPLVVVVEVADEAAAPVPLPVAPLPVAGDDELLLGVVAEAPVPVPLPVPDAPAPPPPPPLPPWKRLGSGRLTLGSMSLAMRLTRVRARVVCSTNSRPAAVW